MKIFGLVACCLMSILVSPQSAFATGGRSDGGGNGINGKPLESYVTDVTALKAYTTYIAPRLEQVRSKVPGIAEAFIEAGKSKTWYFVPKALKELPNKTIGAPIIGITDQIALQTKKSVWVDTLLFNPKKMDSLGQAQLLVHEHFMALMMEHVEAIRGTGHPMCVKYPETCNAVLEPEDYEKIRDFTDLFMNHLEDASPEDISDKFYDLTWIRLTRGPRSINEAYAILQSQRMRQARFVPSFLVTQEILKTKEAELSNGRCRVDFNFLSGSQTLKVKLEFFNPESTVKISSRPLESDLRATTSETTLGRTEIEFDQSSLNFEQTGRFGVRISKVISAPSQPKLGDQRVIASMLIDNEKLHAVGIAVQTYLYSPQSKQYDWEDAVSSYPVTAEQSLTSGQTIVCDDLGL